MNTLFSGIVSLDDEVYDYSGVWTRMSGRIARKAIVRHSDVICRPSGAIDDARSDADAREVIRQLVEQTINDAAGA